MYGRSMYCCHLLKYHATIDFIALSYQFLILIICNIADCLRPLLHIRCIPGFRFIHLISLGSMVPSWSEVPKQENGHMAAGALAHI